MTIALPASAVTVLRDVITPSLALLPSAMASDGARVQLLAIGLQESGFTTRRQVRGPARGLWQFELGGVTGALTHAASRAAARAICAARRVPVTAVAVYGQLEHDDVLACAFARLLLWTDPQPLPVLGDEAGAWTLYLRTWRPGKPRRYDWTKNYQGALRAMEEQG